MVQKMAICSPIPIFEGLMEASVTVLLSMFSLIVYQCSVMMVDIILLMIVRVMIIMITIMKTIKIKMLIRITIVIIMLFLLLMLLSLSFLLILFFCQFIHYVITIFL